jgi:hypothetical protein
VALAAVNLIYASVGWFDDMRVFDDGSCVLRRRQLRNRNKHRVIRLHVNQIKSVEMTDDDPTEGPQPHYIIRFDGGTAKVHSGYPLDAVVARLEKLNPQIDLSKYRTTHRGKHWTEYRPYRRDVGPVQAAFDDAARAWASRLSSDRPRSHENDLRKRLELARRETGQGESTRR